MSFDPERIFEPFVPLTLEIDDVPMVVPGLQLDGGSGMFLVHWFNSQLRNFADPQFNHLEASVDGRVKGIILPPELMLSCVELDWPSRFDPIVDDATMEWYVARQATSLEDELNGLDEQ